MEGHVWEAFMNESGIGTHHLWSIPIVQNAVTWPHLSRGELEAVVQPCALGDEGVDLVDSLVPPQLGTRMCCLDLLSSKPFISTIERIKWNTVYYNSLLTL